jgi:magnesium-transporting ATPase (P-type)
MKMQSYKEVIQSFFGHPETRFILPSALFYCGIMVFCGSLIMFGFGVAPTLFKVLPTKDLAGLANQSILIRMVILQGIGLLIMAGGLYLLRRWSSGHIRRSMVFVFGVIILIYLLYGVVIQYTMFSLQTAIGSFDHPSTSGLKSLEQFNLLHKLYSFLSSMASLLSLAMLVLHMYANRKATD